MTRRSSTVGTASWTTASWTVPKNRSTIDGQSHPATDSARDVEPVRRSREVPQGITIDVGPDAQTQRVVNPARQAEVRSGHGVGGRSL